MLGGCPYAVNRHEISFPVKKPSKSPVFEALTGPQWASLHEPICPILLLHVEDIVKPSAAKQLREEFLAWQCRIRQIAMRQDGARPSPGMRPRLLDASGRELSPALTVRR